MNKKVRVTLLTLFVVFGLAASALPSLSQTINLQPFLSGITSAVFLTSAKDGSRRIFVVQQNGIIKVVQPGTNATTDFLDMTSVVLSGGERGLLGLAFHPQFATNRRLFVYYTRKPDGAIEIAEYRASASNLNIAEPVGKVIISILHPGASNHNGGTLDFGPDGYLYAATGDGGGSNDPGNNAQNIDSLLGKMIRINVNTSRRQSKAKYLVPFDNPYVGISGADEIYALGLRNPYRWSFDRGGTRQLWAADVGQDAIEEVDIITRGGNYGWRVYEGTQCTNLDPMACVPGNYVMPVFQYNHSGGRCSITGGYIYRGTANASVPNGAYVYGDYCSGEIFMWNGSSQILLRDTPRNVLSFGEDEDGEIYVISAGGIIEKIVAP